MNGLYYSEAYLTSWPSIEFHIFLPVAVDRTIIIYYTIINTLQKFY